MHLLYHCVIFLVTAGDIAHVKFRLNVSYNYNLYADFLPFKTKDNVKQQKITAD